MTTAPSYIGKTCPYCQFPLKEQEQLVQCSTCRMPHHQECWQENRGCTTFGCQGTPVRPGNELLATNQDGPLDLTTMSITTARFCTKCGQRNTTDGIFCSRCGNSMLPAASTTTKNAWSGGAFTALIIASIFLPIVGIIGGVYGLTTTEKRTQGGWLLGVALTMSLLHTM